MNRSAIRTAALLLTLILSVSLFAGCKEERSNSSRRRSSESGQINHGHSIEEAGTDRIREIFRSTDVITGAKAAQDFLEENVDLPYDEMTYFLSAETPEDDTAAYQWYEFMVSYQDILVYGTEVRVVCFVDGTIIEGTEVSLANFADSEDIPDPDSVLQIYRDLYGDDDSYEYVEMSYVYYSSPDETSPLCYVYRHEVSGDIGLTIGLDVTDGELIIYSPDFIID